MKVGVAKIFILWVICILGFFALNGQCTISGTRKLCATNVYFYDVKSTTTIASYAWDFNNGKTSTDANPGMIWRTPGTYSISVKVTFKNGNTCTDTHVIKVMPLPTPVFSSNTVQACFFSNKTFFYNNSFSTGTSSGIKKIFVVYGDGSTDAFSNPGVSSQFSHQFLQVGKNNVRLEITDFNGCINDTTIPINISPDIRPTINITENQTCGKHEICWSADIDSMGQTGNSYTWDVDGNITNTNLITKKCSTFVGVNKNLTLKITAKNKFNCFNSDYRIVNIISDTIKETFETDTNICFTDKSYKSFIISNASNFSTYLWKLDGKELSRNSRYDFYVKELFPKIGKYNLHLTIKSGKCIKEFEKNIHVKGFELDLQFINVKQCIQNGIKNVYVVDKSKIGKPNRTWSFNDPKGLPCTTNRAKLQNVKSNCNNAKDYWAKHLYTDVGVYNIDYSVYDSVTGCSADTTVAIKIKDCKSVCNFTGYLNMCVGDLFLPRSMIDGDIPDEYSFDSGITWRKFPSYILPDDEGWKDVLFYFKPQPYVLDATDDDKDITVNTITLPAQYIFAPKLIYIHNLVKNKIIVQEKGFCSYSKFIIKPITSPYVNSETVEIIDAKTSVVLYTKTASGFDPFKEFEIPVQKNEIKRIIVKVKNDYCKKEYFFNLGVGKKLNIILPNVCGEAITKIGAEVEYITDSGLYWNDVNKLGNIFWNINGKDTLQNMYDFNYNTNGKKTNILLIAIDSFGCKDTIKRVFEIGKLQVDMKYFQSPITCGELTQFFDSSSLTNTTTDTIKKYKWIFINNSMTSPLKNPTFSYEGGGIFNIKLIVSTALGCKDSVIKKFEVLGPKPKFSILGDTIGCEPLKITFKNESANCNNYIWFFNDEVGATKTTKSDTNVSHIYKRYGRYYPKLVGSGFFTSPLTGNTYQCNIVYPGNPPYDSVNISVFVLKSDSFIIVGPDSICVNSKAEFTVDPWRKFSDYDWVLNRDSTYSTSNVFQHFFNNTGIYNLSVKNGKNSKTSQCVYFLDKQIKVIGIKADFIYDDALTPKYQFYNKSQNANNYLWNFGDPATGNNNTSTKENPLHTFSRTDKDFTICLLATNNIGCRDSVCKKIHIADPKGVLIPNVFTPNLGDDLNSEFDIKIENEDFYSLEIYNRWGQLLYRSTVDGLRGDGVNWNGKVHNTGAACPEGEYFYKFVYSIRLDDVKHHLSGVITLIRK